MLKPAFLTANTYFWRPGGLAGIRRANERRNHQDVCAWLRSLGFDAQTSGDTTCATQPDGRTVTILYRESVNHVYKKVQVTNTKGKNSNLSIVR